MEIDMLALNVPLSIKPENDIGFIGLFNVEMYSFYINIIWQLLSLQINTFLLNSIWFTLLYGAGVPVEDSHTRGNLTGVT